VAVVRETELSQLDYAHYDIASTIKHAENHTCTFTSWIGEFHCMANSHSAGRFSFLTSDTVQIIILGREKRSNGSFRERFGVTESMTYKSWVDAQEYPKATARLGERLVRKLNFQKTCDCSVQAIYYFVIGEEHII